jgi:hypothetical protein
MANGYLGKISAVVSANTADFSSKLNAAAKDVQSFARSVQSNLTSASRDAARSFESIYTPLQKFERSLQAAASMKLSFKGFAGAIKDVDVLRQRLASMKDSQVSLAVRASGMKNITELREALVGLRAKDLDIVAKVGGIERVRELRALSAENRVDFTVNLIDSGLGRRLAEAKTRVAELKAEVSSVKVAGVIPSGGVAALASQYREATAEVARLREVSRQTIKATLGVNVQKDADVDRLLRAGERAEAIRLPVILDVLGEAAVKEAVTQTQRIRSVAEQINKPFGEATQKLAAMSVEIQAGFLPAMKRSQAQIESLKANIEKGVLPAAAIAQQFDVVEKRASAAASAVSRLAEASSKIGSMKTGQELAFSNPRLSETLDRGVAVGERAASLPATTIQANPRIAEMLGEISTLSNRAVAAYAGLQRRVMLGLPTDSAQKSADALQGKLEELFREFDATYQIHVDAEQAKKDFTELTAKAEKLRDQTAFVVTGRPQTLEQADSRRAALNSEVSGLNRSQRQSLKPLLQDADAARAMGDVDKINDALDKLAYKIAQAKRFNVDFDKAKKDSLDLKATMDSLRAESNFVISAQVQNAGQAEAEIKRIIAGMDQLTPSGRAFIQPTVDAAISSLGTKDIAVISAAVQALSDEFEQEKVLKVRVDEGKKSVESLKASLSSIADRIGDPSQPIDRLRQSVEAANAAIAKMPAGAIKTKLEGDLNSEKIRLEAMAAPSAPRPPDIDIDAAAARANAISADAAAAMPQTTATSKFDLGEDVEASVRQIGVLHGSITSLKSTIDTLPEPIRARFAPAIREAETEFMRLSSAATPIASEIDAARRRVQQLAADASRATQAMNFRQGFGGEGTSGINLGLDQRALQGYAAELQILQGAIGTASAEARGPAVAAFERLRNAVATAYDEGNIDSAVQRERLAAIRAEAVAAAAAVKGVSARSLGRDVARAGDVGRGGADKFALGLNQAAFAIDDFMSSTGGLEFKLRAISNNITQLGFVVGGTAGLFVGLGAVIAGQAAIGIIKWINNGRTAEDQTKALNDALARQKGLVEELAEAFRSLGDSMSRGTLSAVGEQAADFSRQVEEIKKKQEELRKNRVAELDPKVQQERAEQNKLKGQLEKETNIGSRTAIQAQIRASAERERQRSEEALRKGPPSSQQIQGAIARAREVVEFDRSRRSNADPSQFTPEAIKRRAQEAEAGIKPFDIKSQRQALEKQIADLTDDATGFGPEAKRAAEQRNNLEVMLANLELPLNKAIEDLAISLAEASRGPSEQIRQAQEEVAKAIEAGLPGARIFGAELDKIGGRLSEATKKLREAVSGKDANDNPLTVDEKEARTKQAQGEIAALQGELARIAAQADALRYERTVDPQRQIDARMARVGGNLGAAGLENGRIARRMREIENERETIRLRSSMPEFANPLAQAGLQKRQQALNAEVSALEAATIAIKIFAAALDQAAEESKNNLNSAQQAADEARRADLGNSTPQTQEARKQAEADLERQRATERAAQTEIAVERDRLEQQAASPEEKRMQQIDEELKSGREFDPELVKQREKVEADAAAAEESRKKFANVVDTRKVFSDAVQEMFTVEHDMGIRNLPAEERNKKLMDAGRGDVINNFDEAYAGIFKAQEAAGLEGLDFVDVLNVARDELAAAIKRQAQAANALAEIDEKIAAAGMSGDRENLIREREALQAKMEDDARASQAKVDAARDASTREAERAKSGERGRELSRTPEERFMAESEQGLADIKTYFNRRAEANNGFQPVGDVEAQQEAEKRFRKEREKEARTATSEGRGAELGMTERDRFRRDFSEGAGKDINARAKQLRDQGQNPAAFLQQAFRNQMEAVAPMLQGFQEERQNAMLQGPSRAALNVSDVSTSQGASELTRLIRGDDSAKDVNLAELRKQSDKLDEVVKAIREGNPGVLL